MPKIPRQRTGSGGWPDRRRAVSYDGKKKGCGKSAALVLVVPAAVFALGWELASRLV